MNTLTYPLFAIDVEPKVALTIAIIAALIGGIGILSQFKNPTEEEQKTALWFAAICGIAAYVFAEGLVITCLVVGSIYAVIKILPHLLGSFVTAAGKVSDEVERAKDIRRPKAQRTALPDLYADIREALGKGDTQLVQQLLEYHERNNDGNQHRPPNGQP